MNVFNLDLRQSTARGLKKDVDYKEVLDGNGFAHKFVNLENPTVLAGALLDKEDTGSLIGDAQHTGHQQKQRAQEQQAQSGKQDVQ